MVTSRDRNIKTAGPVVARPETRLGPGRIINLFSKETTTTDTVQELEAGEILDSRGQSTIEVICTPEAGHRALASVPAGASTDGREAAELRDKDPARFNGRGVLHRGCRRAPRPRLRRSPAPGHRDVDRHSKAILKDPGVGTGVGTGVGDEGGFAPAVISNRQPLDWLMSAINAAGGRPGDDVTLAVDAAASGLRPAQRDELATEKRELSGDEMIESYEDLASTYPIGLLEDSLHGDDWSGWQRLAQYLGKRLTRVGDDLLVTQIADIERGLEMECANAVLIKSNQVGALTETCAPVALTHGAGWIVTARRRWR